jgi:predicted permease
MNALIENFLFVIEALGPIFFLIILGYGLRHRGFFSEIFWTEAERLTYFLLFPALLVRKLALAELGSYPLVPVASVITATLLIISIVVFGLKPLLGVNGPQFSSIYQGSIRFNTYVGLAAASTLFLEPGVTVAALAIAILIPIINVLCVIVLTTHGTGSHSIRELLAALLRNPLILACLLGILLNSTGLGVPLGSEPVLAILAQAALPIGLLAVGAGLRETGKMFWKPQLVLTAVLKLMALPGITAVLCELMKLEPLESGVLILFAALPGAPSSYILARQMGGDGVFMATIVTLETGLSLVTLPVVLLLLVF